MRRLIKTIRLSVILAIFSILALQITNAPAFAQEETMTADQSTPSAQIKYDLPFPGMLPDNFLYKLKLIRDKVSLMLISDPKDKSLFYLNQADKGILASAILIDKHQIDLSAQTALKAENNMTLLTGEFSKFSSKPDSKYFERLKNASLKHQEVLSNMLGKVPADKQKTFKDVLYFSKQNLKSIEQFQNKKFYTE